jgi:hypothetical protein
MASTDCRRAHLSARHESLTRTDGVARDHLRPVSGIAQHASNQTGTSQKQVARARSDARVNVTFSLAGFHHKLRQEYNLFTSGAVRADGTTADGLMLLTDTSIGIAPTPGLGTSERGSTGGSTGRPNSQWLGPTPRETWRGAARAAGWIYTIRRPSTRLPRRGKCSSFIPIPSRRHEVVGPARSEAERLSLIQLGVLHDGAIATGTDIFPTSFPPPSQRLTFMCLAGRASSSMAGGVSFLSWKPTSAPVSHR